MISSNTIVPDDPTEPLMILFETTSRRALDDLEAWGKAFSGSHIEPLTEAHTVLFLKPGVGESAA